MSYFYSFNRAWNRRSVRNDYPAGGYTSSGQTQAGYLKDTKPDHPVRTTPDVFGWRQPTNYDREVWSGNTHSMYIDARVDFVGQNGFGGYGYSTWTGYAPVPFLPPPSLPGWVKPFCVNGALRKLKDQKVNFSVAFAERAQTAGMIAKSIDRFANLIQALRARDKKTWRRLMNVRRNRDGSLNFRKGADRDIYGLWLEIQFGWKPAASDAYGAIAALHAKDMEDTARYRITVKQGVQERDESEMGWNITLPDTILVAQVKGKYKTVHSGFCRLDYYVTNPTEQTLAELGITNPLEVNWELIPFSFLVDYFIPIGNYLSLLDAANGLTFKGGSFSSVTRMNFEKWTVPGGIGHNTVSYKDTSKFLIGHSKDHFVHMNREKFESSPWPQRPVFDFHGLEKGQRVWNAIALLGQALR
jgi:hypothetical protein